MKIVKPGSWGFVFENFLSVSSTVTSDSRRVLSSCSPNPTAGFHTTPLHLLSGKLLPKVQTVLLTFPLTKLVLNMVFLVL